MGCNMALLDFIQVGLAILAVAIIFSFIAMFIDKGDDEDEKWNT